MDRRITSKFINNELINMNRNIPVKNYLIKNVFCFLFFESNVSYFEERKRDGSVDGSDRQKIICHLVKLGRERPRRSSWH